MQTLKRDEKKLLYTKTAPLRSLKSIFEKQWGNGRALRYFAVLRTVSAFGHCIIGVSLHRDVIL